jgi:hypothetical protein
METADVEMPEEASDLSGVKFATALWDLLQGKREQLSDYLLSALHSAVPIRLFRATETVKRACGVLEQYCPEKLKAVIGD